MMRAVVRAAQVVRDRCVAMSVLRQDAALYGLSALLAAGTVVMAVSVDYRQWAEMSLGPYLLAAGVSLAVARRRERRPASATRDKRDVLRRVIVLVLLLTAVLIPLTVELILRAEAKPGAHAQPEVPVIERCGDRVAQHLNCYPSYPKTPGISPSSDAKNIDANSFFPYLPGMIPFGLINATAGPPELQDARVALSGFTIIVVTGALLVAAIPSKRRWRIFQVAIVLPSGALPIVTGGDDLPVIALLLLSLALATRRRPVLAGFAMGFAGTLKFTAWPLLVVLALSERDRQGRRAILRYLLAALAVVVPVLGVGIGLDPHSFVENAIRFPLGLTRVKSPAASPLVGQELVSLFPAAKPELIALLAAIGVAAVAYGLWRWRPSTPQAAAGFTGLAMLLATLIAPATRFGYLIYPLNLLTWAVLLKPDLGDEQAGAADRVSDGAERDGAGRGAGGHDPSGIWKSRSLTREDADVWSPPASAGEIPGLTGVTTTPTSHS